MQIVRHCPWSSLAQLCQREAGVGVEWDKAAYSPLTFSRGPGLPLQPQTEGGDPLPQAQSLKKWSSHATELGLGRGLQLGCCIAVPLDWETQPHPLLQPEKPSVT